MYFYRSVSYCNNNTKLCFILCSAYLFWPAPAYVFYLRSLLAAFPTAINVYNSFNDKYWNQEHWYGCNKPSQDLAPHGIGIIFILDSRVRDQLEHEDTLENKGNKFNHNTTTTLALWSTIESV